MIKFGFRKNRSGGVVRDKPTSSKNRDKDAGVCHPDAI